MTRAGNDLDGVFGALADPTRRHLLERLLSSGPDTATHLVEGMPVTRQAVVKHLQVLADAGLVTPQRHGREVRYVATPEPLTSAVGWMVDTGGRWDRRLERLGARLAKRGGHSS